MFNLSKFNFYFARLGKVLILGLSFFVSILITRLFGVETLAEYSYLNAILSVLVIFFSFGMNQSVLGYYDKSNTDLLVLSSMKLLLIISFFLFIVFFLNRLLLHMPLLNIDFLLLFVSFLISIVNIFKNKNVLEIKIHIYYYIDLIFYVFIICGFLFCFILLIQPNLTYIFFIVNLLIVIYYLLHEGITLNKLVSTRLDLEFFKSSFLMFISTLILTVSYKFNIFIYENHFNKTILGYYSIVLVLIDGITTFLTSLMFADINLLKKSNFNFLINYIMKFIILSLLIIGIIYFFGDLFIKIVYNIESDEIDLLLKIMIYVVPLIILLKIIQNYFIMNKLYKEYLYGGLSLLGMLIILFLYNSSNYLDVVENYIYSILFSIIVAVYLLKRTINDF